MIYHTIIYFGYLCGRIETSKNTTGIISDVEVGLTIDVGAYYVLQSSQPEGQPRSMRIYNHPKTKQKNL